MANRVCVISSGVTHAVSRTIAITEYFSEIDFIDLIGNLSSQEFENSTKVKLHQLKHWGKSSRAYKDFWTLLKKIEPDLIICHYASGYHYFLSVLYGQCPVAVICMGSDILHEQGVLDVPYLKRCLIRHTLKKTSFISAKSKYLAARIKSNGIKQNIDINYWGCDLSHFKRTNRSLQRSLWDITPNSLLVLSPRALNPVYNIDLIIKAFADVIHTIPNAKLVILGRTSDTEYVARIYTLVDSLNLGDHILFLGEVPQKDLPKYYSASDLVVSMARGEGFPNTLLEAMGCETLCLAGDIPQIHEILTHKENAYICKIEVPSIVKSITELLSNKSLRKKISSGGLQVVQEFGDINKNGLSFKNSLEPIMATWQKTGGFVAGSASISDFTSPYY